MEEQENICPGTYQPALRLVLDGEWIERYKKEEGEETAQSPETRTGASLVTMVTMPETPEELEVFVQGVRDNQALELQRETLAEIRQLSERQARLEGRVEELSHTVQLYRQDFQSLLERFDHFQSEIRTENEKFRQEIRTENEKFRQEMRAENEKFRQEVWGRFGEIDQRFEKIDQCFEKIDQRFEKIDQRFERMEARLFDMQKSLTLQTRWLVALLVAAPVIYSVMEKLLNSF